MVKFVDDGSLDIIADEYIKKNISVYSRQECWQKISSPATQLTGSIYGYALVKWDQGFEEWVRIRNIECLGGERAEEEEQR